jgi:NAD(P)-dependent dehydrogenase (short-subunit alcohol dehydrogenase family)
MGVELAPQNIRVNSVAPTFLDTPFTVPFFKDPKFKDWVLQRIPLGSIGQLERSREPLSSWLRPRPRSSQAPAW